MIEHLTPEAVKTALESFAYLLPLIAAIGLSSKQRLAIKERDGNKCQAVKDGIKCGGSLEVDHVVPKRFAEEVLGFTEEQYNSPINLLTKCFNHHRGHPKSKHPDIHIAQYQHREGDREAISRVFEKRDALIDQGLKYWNDSHDYEDAAKALELTNKALKKRWIFPKVNHRKKRPLASLLRFKL